MVTYSLSILVMDILVITIVGISPELWVYLVIKNSIEKENQELFGP